ncbi:MAG: hypothetical protein WBA46_09445, partial [Thermomicrobiales bacterium]
EFHRNKVNSDEARLIVEDVIQRRLNRRMTVTCVTREEAQAMIAQRAPTSAPDPSPKPVEAAAPTLTEPAAPAAPEEARAEAPATPAHVAATDAASPETSASEPQETRSPFEPELDEARLTAVRNIFDAEDVDDDTEFV